MMAVHQGTRNETPTPRAPLSRESATTTAEASKAAPPGKGEDRTDRALLDRQKARYRSQDEKDRREEMGGKSCEGTTAKRRRRCAVTDVLRSVPSDDESLGSFGEPSNRPVPFSSLDPVKKFPERTVAELPSDLRNRSDRLSFTSVSSAGSGSVDKMAGGGGGSTSYRRRLSSMKRRSSSLSVDIYSRQDRVLFDDRESHTVDLDELDRYLIKMKRQERDFGEPPFSDRLWGYLRKSLEEHARPTGYGPHDSGPSVCVPKGPEDATKFLKKKFALDEFSPINPATLAAKTGMSRDRVLTELLQATDAGLTTMMFSPECTRCGGAVCARSELGKVSGRAVSCGGCSYVNDVHSLDGIAVVFFLRPEVLYVLADSFGCTPSKASLNETLVLAPVPGTTTGSGFRYSIGCGATPITEKPLERGRYRMHCLISKTDGYIDVLGGAPDEGGEKTENCTDDRTTSGLVSLGDSAIDEPHPHELVIPLRVSDFKMDGEERAVLSIPHGRCHFDVLPDTGSFFALWLQRDISDEVVFTLPPEERAPFTSAGSVLNHPSYARRFPSGKDDAKVLTIGSSLETGNVVLVFTDVVGSTDMYADLGDWRAMELVERHYKVLFGAFGRSGRVVKTIEDAVMAAFATGRAALEAAAAALAEVEEQCGGHDGGPSLKIRVGIHAGPAVVVPLNGINDYFGQTVNLAARVEGKAAASSCLVTEAVLSDPDARTSYHELVEGEVGTFEATPPMELDLKGIRGKVQARGFRLASSECCGDRGGIEAGLECTNPGARGECAEDGCGVGTPLPPLRSSFQEEARPRAN